VDLKKEDDLKNDDDLENEDDLKNDDDLKNEDDLRDGLKKYDCNNSKLYNYITQYKVSDTQSLDITILHQNIYQRNFLISGILILFYSAIRCSCIDDVPWVEDTVIHGDTRWYMPRRTW